MWFLSFALNVEFIQWISNFNAKRSRCCPFPFSIYSERDSCISFWSFSNLFAILWLVDFPIDLYRHLWNFFHAIYTFFFWSISRVSNVALHFCYSHCCFCCFCCCGCAFSLFVSFICFFFVLLTYTCLFISCRFHFHCDWFLDEHRKRIWKVTNTLLRQLKMVCFSLFQTTTP